MHARNLTVLLVAFAVVAAGCLEAPAGTTDEPVAPDSLELPEEVKRLVAGAPCVAELPSPEFHPDASVEEWEGEVPADAAAGRLSVASYRGGVLIAPWNQSAYRVQVGELDGDDRLTPTVDAGVQDGVWTLTVEVAREGGASGSPLAVNQQRPVAQVMVWVPQLHYEEVRVSDHPEEDFTDSSFQVNIHTEPREGVWESFVTGGLQGDALRADFLDLDVVAATLRFATVNATTLDGDVALHDVVGDAVGAGSHDGDLCASGVKAERLSAASMDGDVAVRGVEANHTRAFSHDGSIVAAGVRAAHVKASAMDGHVTVNDTVAERVRLASHDGDVAAHGVRATNLTLSSMDGDVLASDATATAVRLSSHDGDVAADGLRAARVNASSMDGDVALAVAPTESGHVSASSHDGTVVVRVPAGEAFGYNATATTHDGTAAVNLSDARTNVSEDGTRATGRTMGFADRAIQVQVRASSMQGDALVTDDA